MVCRANNHTHTHTHARTRTRTRTRTTHTHTYPHAHVRTGDSWRADGWHHGCCRWSGGQPPPCGLIQVLLRVRGFRVGLSGVGASTRLPTHALLLTQGSGRASAPPTMPTPHHQSPWSRSGWDGRLWALRMRCSCHRVCNVWAQKCISPQRQQCPVSLHGRCAGCTTKHQPCSNRRAIVWEPKQLEREVAAGCWYTAACSR